MEKLKFDIADSIVKHNFKRELLSLSKFATRSVKGIREHDDPNKIPDRINVRSTFFRDIDRILHSQSYTRYIDKTQVFYLFENDHITHRVLHVQLVSKIARTIGRCLALNEDLIEAIALGHDIGHAPFGHNGERYLNSICSQNKIGCFIHNAQSVRFLHYIENEGKGLNLTLQVLDGILSHNGEILNRRYEPGVSKDFDLLKKELDLCFIEQGYDKKIIPMTLEGCVVRISDVIAYIARDIDDAVTLGIIERDEIPMAATNILGQTNAEIINTLVVDIINNSYNRPYLEFSENVYDALSTLKDFNYKNIYSNPLKSTQDEKIQNIFIELFDIYKKELESGNSRYIYKWANDKIGKRYSDVTDVNRIVIDYLAGMTDDFLIKEFQEYFLPKSFGYKVDKSV